MNDGLSILQFSGIEFFDNLHFLSFYYDRDNRLNFECFVAFIFIIFDSYQINGFIENKRANCKIEN